MDGSNLLGIVQQKPKRKANRRNRYRLGLKNKGLNEHHRQPRCRQGGRGRSDLNIVKVGIKIHRCFHAIFGTELPAAIVAHINKSFDTESEYLVQVPTKFFPTFHRYFTNRQVLKLVGMAGHGLTWGHLSLYGTQADLVGIVRTAKHFFLKPDPHGDPDNRWLYLFHTLTMSVMAYELTRYWLPLDCVVIAIPKEHQVEVDAFLGNLVTPKRKR